MALAMTGTTKAADVPTIPIAIERLPANSAVTPIIQKHLAEFLRRAQRAKQLCKIGDLDNVLADMQDFAKRLAIVAGNQTDLAPVAQTAQPAVANLIKDFQAFLAQQRQDCARERRRVRDRRIDAVVEQATHSATASDLRIRNPLRKAAVGRLRQLFERAQQTCNVALMQRVIRQLRALVGTLERPAKQLQTRIDAGRGSANDKQKLEDILFDGFVIQSMIRHFEEQIEVCDTRKRLGIPSRATEADIRARATEAVDKQIAEEERRQTQGRQTPRIQDQNGGAPEKKDDRDARVDGVDGDKQARADDRRPLFEVEVKLGARFTGSNNQSLATALRNGSIGGVGKSSGGDGFSHQTTAALNLGFGTSIIFSFGASRSKGSSTFRDATGTGYAAYVNGNPLAGFGRNGIYGQSTFDELVHRVEFDIVVFGVSFAEILDNLSRDLAFSPKRQRDGLGHAGRPTGGGGAFGGWKVGFVGGVGLVAQHNRLLEELGHNALTIAASQHTSLQTNSLFIAPKFTLGVRAEKPLGPGAFYGKLIGTLAPGITRADARADQSIRVLNTRANAMRSERTSRGNIQTSLSATVGYTLWGMKAGVTGSWQWEANRAYMRMPTGIGGARLKFKPVHSFAVMGFIKIPLP